MSSKFDSMYEGLTAIVLSPVILPIAEFIRQPFVQKTITDSILLSESVKDTVTELSEVWVHIITGNRKYQDDNYIINNRAKISEEIINIISDMNVNVGKMTNGIADLRVILPTVIALMALQQLLKKGLQLEEIPWYILAWYAFDMFTQLNIEYESQLNNLSINAVSIELQEKKKSDSNNT